MRESPSDDPPLPFILDPLIYPNLLHHIMIMLLEIIYIHIVCTVTCIHYIMIQHFHFLVFHVKRQMQLVNLLFILYLRSQAKEIWVN